MQVSQDILQQDENIKNALVRINPLSQIVMRQSQNIPVKEDPE
jgi:hypothetical protein